MRHAIHAARPLHILTFTLESDWRRERNWLSYHCSDWQNKSDSVHVSSPQTLMKVMNGHEKITMTHSLPWPSLPPSLPPPSPSGKFTVACQPPWAPDPYSRWYQGIAGGRHENIECVNRHVAHKSVNMSQRLTVVGIYSSASPGLHFLTCNDSYIYLSLLSLLQIAHDLKRLLVEFVF